MTNEELRQLQLTELEICKEIVRVCDEYNLTYFLSGGTLLGAIRHNGFIPWDDDMDICLLREDFDKLVRILPTSLRDDYEFVDWNNEHNYGIAFPKVMKKNTFLAEHNNSVKNKRGIYVDIFPLDYISNDMDLETKCCKKMYFYKRLLLAKCGYRINDSFVKKVVYFILKGCAMFYSKQTLIDKINKCIMDYSKKDKKYCYELADSGVGVHNVSKKYLTEDFNGTIKVKFEDVEFNAPIGYKDVLTRLYGDYMQLPPESERYNYHNIETICFDTTKG